jgi:hypothetical protein
VTLRWTVQNQSRLTGVRAKSRSAWAVQVTASGPLVGTYPCRYAPWQSIGVVTTREPLSPPLGSRVWEKA